MPYGKCTASRLTSRRPPGARRHPHEAVWKKLDECRMESVLRVDSKTGSLYGFVRVATGWRAVPSAAMANGEVYVPVPLCDAGPWLLAWVTHMLA